MDNIILVLAAAVCCFLALTLVINVFDAARQIFICFCSVLFNLCVGVFAVCVFVYKFLKSLFKNQ